MKLTNSWHTLSHAWGGPCLRGRFKVEHADFRVEEQLGFEPDGAGEHLWVFIEKAGMTTFQAQSLLAAHFKVALRDIAFSGMKDRQGITRQWFSIHVKTFTDAQIFQFQHPDLHILRHAANSRKLRRGSHKSNRFHILLRDVSGDTPEGAQRLALIKTRGVPNYFGSQRFGSTDDNTSKSLGWFQGTFAPADRNERSLLLSAARSFLFNAVLDERVRTQSWNTCIDGDVMALAGSASVFASSRASADELTQRLTEFDIHPTGPMWGKGKLATSGAAGTLEQNVVSRYPELAVGLEARGLEQERRPLRLSVDDLHIQFDNTELQLEFNLQRGAYATSVLRELIVTEYA